MERLDRLAKRQAGRHGYGRRPALRQLECQGHGVLRPGRIDDDQIRVPLEKP